MAEQGEGRGSCLGMCPPEERDARERQKRLDVLELPSDQYPSYPVKEFSRSAAGRHIHSRDLRPARVLLTTMDYLLQQVVERQDQPWTTIYHFVFDRIRAVRQDMVIQMIEDPSAIEILEKAARFLIFAGFHLCDATMEHFDSSINDSHVQECLKRLLVLYMKFPYSTNRAEFESYYLLHNLGSNEAMDHALRLPDHIKCQHIYRLAWDISLMKVLGNFVVLFRLVRQLPFLASCIIQKHIASICNTATAVLNAAFSNPRCQFPLKDLSSILMFNNEQEAQTFFVCFGIEVNNGLVKFSKKTFHVPDKLPTRVQSMFIAKKMTYSIKNVLVQGCLPIQDCKTNDSSDKERESQQRQNQIEEIKIPFVVSKTVLGRGREANVSNFENPRKKPVGRGRSRGRNTENR